MMTIARPISYNSAQLFIVLFCYRITVNKHFEYITCLYTCNIFLLLSTNLAREWLQIDTDLLRTGDELSGGTNIDDLE